MILVSNIGFLYMPDLVTWPQSTLDMTKLILFLGLFFTTFIFIAIKQ